MTIHPKMNTLECSQHFSHYKFMGNFSNAEGQLIPHSLVGSCWMLNPLEILWLYSLPARMKKIQSKMGELEWSQDFPRYNPMGAICCHGKQSSGSIWTKILCSVSPTPMMLYMKFDINRPAGLRDLHVWKCGQTDVRRLEFHPISFPGAFGSGELKKNKCFSAHFLKNRWGRQFFLLFSISQQTDEATFCNRRNLMRQLFC